MTANFILYQNYAIHFADKHLDLHNNFDFKSFSFDIDTRTLTLNWKSKNAKWVPLDNPSNLSLRVIDVEYLKVVPRDSETPFTEDNCLSDLTYYPSSERQEDDCVSYQESPTTDDDIIFKFQSEQMIRVKGSEISVSIE